MTRGIRHRATVQLLLSDKNLYLVSCSYHKLYLSGIFVLFLSCVATLLRARVAPDMIRVTRARCLIPPPSSSTSAAHRRQPPSSSHRSRASASTTTFASSFFATSSRSSTWPLRLQPHRFVSFGAGSQSSRSALLITAAASLFCTFAPTRSVAAAAASSPSPFSAQAHAHYRSGHVINHPSSCEHSTIGTRAMTSTTRSPSAVRGAVGRRRASCGIPQSTKPFDPVTNDGILAPTVEERRALLPPRLRGKPTE